MNRFEVATPKSTDEAVRLLESSFDDAAVLAGGTDLLSLMKDFVVEPKRLVSLDAIAELRGITEGAYGGAVVGAMTTIDDLLGSAYMTKTFPGIAQAAEGIASPQMRSMGTVGGELLQRPRSVYFRRGLGLLAQHDGASLVEAGVHRDHAIFGNDGPAKFVHASSLAPVLIAVGARVTAASARGTRRIEAHDLFTTPADEGERETTLAPDEILTSIELPVAAPHSATVEIRHRKGLDWPEAAAACSLEFDGDRVSAARVVLGHVAPTPWIVDLGDALRGKVPDDAAAAAAGEAAAAGATPMADNGHKVQLVRAATRRAVLRAAARDF